MDAQTGDTGDKPRTKKPREKRKGRTEQQPLRDDQKRLLDDLRAIRARIEEHIAIEEGYTPPNNEYIEILQDAQNLLKDASQDIRNRH